MKFRKILTLLFIGTFVLSCTTDIEPLDPSLNPNLNGGGGGNNANAIFTADIDGTFNDFSSTVIAEQSQDGLSVGTLGNPTLAVQIFNPAVGSFNIDANSPNTGALIVYSAGANSLYVPTSGTVIITSYNATNQTVSGTFNGVMEDIAGVDPDVIITNGVFQNITFDISAPTDMASATINGNPFVADFFASIEVSNSIGITFSNSVNEQIGLSFPINIAVGTYTIESFGSGSMYTGTYSNDSVNNGSTHNSVAGSGNIVITDRTNNVLTGTFEFTAVDPSDPTSSFDITNGSFVFDIN
jgi:hypothetical protein